MVYVNRLSSKPLCLAFESQRVVSNKAKRRLMVRSDKREFEVDQYKAKEALKKLDKELKTISETPIRSPKIRAADVILANPLRREEVLLKEEVPEFSPSFLAYTAGALILFTIFYNVFFITVVKPSVDPSLEPQISAVNSQIEK